MNKKEKESKSLRESLGFQGYENYAFKMTNDCSYLFWTDSNDKLLEVTDWDWEIIFSADSYLEMRGVNGHLFPQLPIVANRLIDKDFIKNREKNYQQFLRHLKIDNPQNIGVIELSALGGYRTLLLSEIQDYVKIWEQIDEEIRAVIKVFFYEVRKNIKENAAKEKKSDLYNQLINDVRHLYSVGIRQLSSMELLVENWLPKRIYKHIVSDVIKKSTATGIQYLIKKKEPFIESTKPIYERLIHLESARADFNSRGFLGSTNQINEISHRDTFTELIEEQARYQGEEIFRTFRELYQTHNKSLQDTYELMCQKMEGCGVIKRYSRYESFIRAYYRFNKK